MELIRQNPYHVIGIWAGSNQRIIAKQKAKINAFLNVGRGISFDTDLTFIGNPDRSRADVEKAFAGIEMNRNKLSHALFWFTNHNHLDETALSYLQAGDVEKTEEIWQKITNGKEVSSRNFTAFNNLSTLALATAFANDKIDLTNLKEGVRLKTELLTSASFPDFCHLVTDETYTVDQEKELAIFVNALLEESNKVAGVEAKQIPALIGSVHPKLTSLVAAKLTDTPLHNLERKTELTKKKRNQNPEAGLQLGNDLYKETKNDLRTLSELLGKPDLKYKMVADKLAKELLQCGIDYFKEYQDREEEHGSGGVPQAHAQYAGGSAVASDDLGSAVMKLFITAKSIAVGAQTKDRVAENIQGLQEWIDDADSREKERLIGDDLKFVATKLERFQRLPDTIENADDLVSSCKPRLFNMRKALGAQDDFYLNISSAVVNNAQGMLVTVINAAQENPRVRWEIEGLKTQIREALKVSKNLGTLDMIPLLQAQYSKNHSALRGIGSQLGISSLDLTPPQNPPRKVPVSDNSSSPSKGLSYWLMWVGGIGILFFSLRACAG
jgi:hypothetical protein